MNHFGILNPNEFAVAAGSVVLVRRDDPGFGGVLAAGETIHFIYPYMTGHVIDFDQTHAWVRVHAPDPTVAEAQAMIAADPELARISAEHTRKYRAWARGGKHGPMPELPAPSVAPEAFGRKIVL